MISKEEILAVVYIILRVNVRHNGAREKILKSIVT